ncbi:MAG: glycoside hydrolase family 3 C-terminal domain-containing protein, partial [Flavihumibacter sp.]
AIALAASFNPERMQQCADIISTEARAKYNLARAANRHLQYMGLTFWSPNINLFRDPRWGRGQETYGEDPFLTAAMGTAFVKGLQGNDLLHLKTAAAAKHLAVHSGPEKGRHEFNAVVTEKELRETYLYAFHQLVDSGVEGIMCAYNRLNGEPCCTSNTLIRQILRKEWKFSGHMVTDCGALDDVFRRHKTYPDGAATAAAAIKAGISLECGAVLQRHVKEAMDRKLLAVKDIDSALAPIFRTQVKLGFFDPVGFSKYDAYTADSIANDYHRYLNRKMAAESMVLLKNNNNLLPLKKENYPALMVVGPNAGSIDALLGSYHGVSDKGVNVVEGITAAVGPGTRVEYDMGCDYADTSRFGGIWAAGNANITIAVLGLTAVYEGEEGDAFLAENGADRKHLELPAAHVAYLKALRKGTKTPLVLVINAGSAIDISQVEPYADAILMAWYPGDQGGHAIADVLFGRQSPSGRLPVTFYKSLNDLPAYENYDMQQGRTYRYFKGTPLYPFGFGLSYATFSCEWITKPVWKNGAWESVVSIRNTGHRDATETLQVYVSAGDQTGMPLKELRGFQKVFVPAGKSVDVTFVLPLSQLQKWDEAKRKWYVPAGKYQLQIAANARDNYLAEEIEVK